MDKSVASVSAWFLQYGKTPLHVVVMHGGPSGAGAVQPLAQELGERGYRFPCTFPDGHHYRRSNRGTDGVNRRRVSEAVWTEANALRSSGELMHRLVRVRCPVTAIHRDHDPHPAIGVEEPLATVLPGADFILLAR